MAHRIHVRTSGCRDQGRRAAPSAGSASTGTSEAAAWQTIPSWYLVSRTRPSLVAHLIEKADRGPR